MNRREPAGSSPSAASGFRRVAANIGALLTTNVVNRATSFIVYLMVARQLGVTELGRLALAMALFQMIGRFTMLGLQTLTTREVAKEPTSVSRYVQNAGAVVGVSSLVAYVAMLALVFIAGYAPETSQVIWLLFLGLMPFVISQILDAAFLGLERVQYVTLVSAPVNIAQTIVTFVLLSRGYDVRFVALSIAVAYAAIALIEGILLVRIVEWHWRRPSPRFAREIVRKASPFLGIDGANAVKTTAAPIILSLLIGEAAVGVYSAAAQLQIPLRILANAVGFGLFPVMVKGYRRSTAALRRISSVALEAVVAVILPAVVGLVVIGDELLPFLYGGEGFSESVTVLRIVAWVALASAITTILGQTLWAAGRELVALRIDVVNAVVMITASLTFISLWGVPGAAIAALVVALLNVVQQYLPVAGLLDGFPMGRMLWRPVLAAVAMTAVLLAADDYHLVTRVILGSGAYVLAIAALTLSTGGGWAGVKSRWDLEDATNP